MSLFALLLLASAQAKKPEAPAPRALAVGEGWARDVVFPSAEAIVIVDWDGNARVSTDAGRTWSKHAASFVEMLTVDPRGAIWGLYRWHGIHEESSAALLVSKDVGRTWSTLDLDPQVCMPEAFVTAPGEEPLLIAADGQLWRHAPGEAETFERWSRLGVPTLAKFGSCGIAIGECVYAGARCELSADLGAHWKPATLEPPVVAFARAIDRDGAFTSTVWACTDDAVLQRVELGGTEWRPAVNLAPPRPKQKPKQPLANPPRIFHIATGRDGIYVCGEDGVNALGARVEADGTVVKLAGLAGNQALRLRLAPDGRMWVVGQGVYRAEPGATSWKRVWPE